MIYYMIFQRNGWSNVMMHGWLLNWINAYHIAWTEFNYWQKKNVVFLCSCLLFTLCVDCIWPDHKKTEFLDIMEVISHDISNILFKCIVGYYRATWVTFKPKLEKIKIFTIGKFLIFQEMKLSSSKIKNDLAFQEIELSSSNIKIFFIFQEMELSSLIIFLYFRKKLSNFEK